MIFFDQWLIHFYITNIKINIKALSVPISRISKVRFKLKKQLELLQETRTSISFWVDRSFIGTDSNIFYIKKIINVQH